MKHIVNIKGKDWTYILMTDKKYEKLHGGDSAAMVLQQEKEVHISKSGCNFGNLAHETCHVLVFASLIESASLTAAQMEEMMCDIVGEHYFDIGSIVGEVLNKFLIPKKKPEKEDE